MTFSSKSAYFCKPFTATLPRGTQRDCGTRRSTTYGGSEPTIRVTPLRTGSRCSVPAPALGRTLRPTIPCRYRKPDPRDSMAWPLCSPGWVATAHAVCCRCDRLVGTRSSHVCCLRHFQGGGRSACDPVRCCRSPGFPRRSLRILPQRRDPATRASIPDSPPNLRFNEHPVSPASV